MTADDLFPPRRVANHLLKRLPLHMVKRVNCRLIVTKASEYRKDRTMGTAGVMQIDALKAILAHEDTILFIGSGISLWSGLPSWPMMIEELAQFIEQMGINADLVRQEANKGDLLQAASYGFDRLTKQQIGEFVRSACRSGIAKPHEIHRKIVSLGPRCFITTNYDDLIEQSLRTWQPNQFYRPSVTNRHLTETAEIVHARSINFVFKPHGDAGDSDSIILTREQYRLLMAHGERHAALESLKMLLASRPVVYFGFGLRDPDFIYIRDLLANTYKGGSRDHYAIMADIRDQELDYWRRHYGIHMIGYDTRKDHTEYADHSALLTLLDELLARDVAPKSAVVFKPDSAEVVLALARHASALSRAPRLTQEYPIRVRAEAAKNGFLSFGKPIRFDHVLVNVFLTAGPRKALLTGLPGAGKSYSMRRAAATLAERLHEACLASTFYPKDVVIPLYVDLKLYRGDLRSLVERTLPADLPLDQLLNAFQVKIFLDSFNELPKEYWESGTYERDFQKFLSYVGDASILVSSRTSDGLDKFEIPIYSLDHIDDTIIESELHRLGINLEGRFREEMIRLLQRPFFFQYVSNRSIKLPSEPHPRDFYQTLLKNVSEAFSHRFGVELDIESALSAVAYDSLNRGEEAFPLSGLLTILQVGRTADLLQQAGLSAADFANWLVSVSLLAPYSGARVAFIHQSITEYLASTELARRYIATPSVLSEKMALKRWDQALLLTLSLLPLEKAEDFLKEAVEIDFELALNASKYVEMDRDSVIRRLLSDIPNRVRIDRELLFSIGWILEKLPLNESHEPQLREIIELGDATGGAAISQLISIKGDSIKDDALRMLADRHHDFNFCRNGLAPALAPYLTEDDIGTIANLADRIDQISEGSDNEDAIQGFVSGCSVLLSEFELSTVASTLLPLHADPLKSKTRIEILCDLLMDSKGTEALSLAGDLLLQGINKSVVSIYFIGKFSKPIDEVCWDSITHEHVEKLVSLLDVEHSWALDALRVICSKRPELAEYVFDRANIETGLRKAAMLYCARSDLQPIFSALDYLAGLPEEQVSGTKYEVLRHVEFDWSENRTLFIKLIKLRDSRLAGVLFGGMCPPELPGLGRIDVGDIRWWLNWMQQLVNEEDTSWLTQSLGMFLAEYADANGAQELLAEFQREESEFREILIRYVVPYLRDISTDVLTDDTISYALADLYRAESVVPVEGHLLGRAATERFITERLLPLLPIAEGSFASNLRLVLNQAGDRHGKRYHAR